MYSRDLSSVVGHLIIVLVPVESMGPLRPDSYGERRVAATASAFDSEKGK